MTARLIPVSTEAVPTVAVPGGWDGLFAGRPREELERALPGFLREQRWFGGKARPVEAVSVADWGPLPAGPATAFLLLLDVRFADGRRDTYCLPLAVSTGAAAVELVDAMRPSVLARLDGPTAAAVLHDALADDAVCAALLDAVAAGREFATRAGRVRAVNTPAFAPLRGDPGHPLPAARGPATSSNSLVFFGRRLLLKLFRRLEEGVNPDFEVGRFLTETGRFAHTPAAAGALEYHRPGAGPVTLAILQALVPNQGDGWGHALEELGRYYDRAAGRTPGSDPVPPDVIGSYLQAAAALGRRTAEMHLALAGSPDDPAFAPEPLTAADVAALRAEMREQGEKALAALAGAADGLPAEVRADAQRLLTAGPAAIKMLAEEASAVPAATKIRCHGDYHLGQVLWADNDYVILDFEGEPTRTVEARRAKYSPLRDVAGMLRSYHYAAYAGLFAATRDRPDDFGRLEPWADLWHQWVSAAFLRAYTDITGGAGFLPQEPAAFADLLNRWTLAKAFYELVYELNNRPDWVRIPLRGVLALLPETMNGER